MAFLHLEVCSCPGTYSMSQDLHDPWVERASLNVYLHWQAGSLPLAPPGKGSLSTQVSLKLYTKKVLMVLRRAAQAHS